MSKRQISNSLRSIPSVEKVLQTLGPVDLPRASVVALVRRELAGLRSADEIPEFERVVENIQRALSNLQLAKIQPVINGTGILIHTNLGRSPLGTAVIKTLTEIASNYNNLEFDLATGERGGRAHYLEQNLALLCESEAATVVNNCAAALMLILRHFTAGVRKSVIISRGELVQIGGGFRIPEILGASGAQLREIGTTNQTTLTDYERAIGSDTALILKVHRSNFFMEGFVDSPATEEISRLATASEIPFVEDLGSGAVFKTESMAAIEHEPTPAEILRKGVDLVCFSGDKLFGGPQAGIIAGSKCLIDALKREPLFRALRCDKLILSALQTTVDLYLRGNKDSSLPDGTIPVQEMISAPEQTLRLRAETLIKPLQGLALETKIIPGKCQIGGGTLPRSEIASLCVAIIPKAMPLAALAQKLRTRVPPVIGYISGGALNLDLRTIFPHQDAAVAQALRDCCVSGSS